jgi:Tol biopolymer transport system component
LSNATIFISYRREDTSGHAGRLFDRLAAHFGAERIFMDIDTIKPGVDFVTVIDQAVASCSVLLALIGHQWLTVSDRSGKRRLDDPHDFNRLEIESGLKRATTVIPVLVQETAMPRPDELPSSMAELARRNAIELSDARWDYDVQRLITTIEEIVGKPPAAPESGRRRLLGWVLAGAVVVATAVTAALLLIGRSPACGGSAASIATSDIAFLSSRDNNVEIYGMSANGARFARFTDDSVNELRPDWSPNGRQLVFGIENAAGGGNHTICIRNADGSGSRILGGVGANAEAPDWSPDGSKIAFASGSGTHTNIFVIPADGNGGPANLTGNANHNMSPDWSPHGDKIAFSSNPSGPFHIFVMDARGHQVSSLTTGPGSDRAPAWSSKGNKIAFVRKTPGESRIFVMNADGANVHPLTRGKVTDSGPSWGPHDNTIIFARNDGGTEVIYTLNPRTAHPQVRALKPGPGPNFDPAWRP